MNIFLSLADERSTLLQLFSVKLSIHWTSNNFCLSSQRENHSIWEMVLPNKSQLQRKCKTKGKYLLPVLHFILHVLNRQEKAAFGKVGLWYCDIKDNCKWFYVQSASHKQNLPKGNRTDKWSLSPTSTNRQQGLKMQLLCSALMGTEPSSLHLSPPGGGGGGGDDSLTFSISSCIPWCP